MKSGKSLTELAAEVQRQQATRRDYIADVSSLDFVHTTRPMAKMTLDTSDAYLGITEVAHQQLAGFANVPNQYYNRILTEYPDLWARTLNTLVPVQHGTRRMVRTLDGNMRAFLSDRYRRLDNAELLESVLPVFQQFPGLRVESCEITERRLYLKAVYPRVEAEVKKGDVVQAGIVISNSEVGSGSYNIQQMVFRLVCLNGLITGSAMRKTHLGRRAEEDGEMDWSDETRQADDRALFLKTRDTVKSALNGLSFTKTVEQLRIAAQDKMEASPVKAVEVLANTIGLAEREKDSVLRYLIEGGDLSRYGMSNAVTRMAQDVESYDRSTDLEVLGHRIITLPRSDWGLIAQAA